MASKKNDKGDLSSIPIRILIIDDDEAHAQAVADCLERVGSDCTVATSGESGAKLIESENYDVVITDLKMDDLDGLQILARTREELPDAEVIVLTGHGSIHSAVTAMQHGANTYLTKPLDINELRTAVEKASDRLRLIRRNAELRRQLDEKFGFEGVIGTSPQMKKVIDVLKIVAPTEASVLITGENGTGKELVARALHQNSPRKNKPFVPINISAIPESILESELFGHEAGAFTGAKPGGSASSSTPTAARCFWMKSAKCPSTRKSSCSACWKTAKSRDWDRTMRFPSMSGSSRPPMPTCKSWSPRSGFGSTCIIG